MRIELTPAEAMDRIHVVTAHLWMVRTMLKHAEEMETDPDRMEVPRQAFDFVRALEPKRVAGDAAGYLKMVRRKLHRLRRVAEWFARERPAISAHTNFEQAALSLSGSVRQIEDYLAGVVDDGSAAGADTPDDGPDDPPPSRPPAEPDPFADL